VLILSGDQLYRMNYLDMLHTHTQSGADVSIAALPVSREAAKAFGIMRLDESGRVNGFVEKPTTDAEIDSVRMSESWFAERGLHIHGRECLASMGIYLFNRDLLVETLRSTTHEDFGRQVFPSLIDSKHVQVHPFDGYWEDIGTIKAFYDANLQLASRSPPFDLAKPESLMFSRARFLPPSRFEGAQITSSLIADGCRIGHGAHIEKSVIGLRCVVGENAVIKDSVIMGADEYETDSDLREDLVRHVPPIGIGANTTIAGAIVDKNCRIGSGVKIEKPADAPLNAEDERFVIRDGITVIEKDACLPDGWQLTLET
jgi:glucose-1-phosphate adenylyltransferase